MELDSTIVAVSSAAGSAARMIVRVTGDQAFALARRLVDDELPAPPAAFRTQIRVETLRIASWLYLFAGPRSYTGQDLVEIHLPGNPLLGTSLFNALTTAGARPAEPGEYTARAYFNGRLDLTQAEGVAATVSAANANQLRAARSLLAGELPRRLAPITESLVQLLARIEAQIDFADEGVGEIPADELSVGIWRVRRNLQTLVNQSGRFERISHAPRIVLAGRPNAGKSTLLNALAGCERAMTSPRAGTTRDVLSALAMLPSGQVTLIDAAGLTEPGDDPIEIAMQARAHAAAAAADVLALVRDPADSLPPPELPREADLTILTKQDIHPSPATHLLGRCVSAHSGWGMASLRADLDRLAFGDSAAGAGLALNARHVRAIDECLGALARIEAAMPAELIALELREALDALGSILGQVTPDDILGRVFSSFCIGK